MTMSRTSRLTFLIATVAVVLLGGIFFVAAKPCTSVSATTTTDQTTAKAVGTESAQAAPVAPPGTIFYTAKNGESMPGLVRRLLWQSTYMTAPEFEAAIRERNGGFKGVFLKAGQQLIIPGMDGLPTSEKPVTVPRDHEVKAIYLTGLMAASPKGMEIVKHWQSVGGNAVVF